LQTETDRAFFFVLVQDSRHAYSNVIKKGHTFEGHSPQGQITMLVVVGA
tara:strand:- start:66 stop:212 length:147 start_codon:yes stop_codon:yes gene_type:complete